MKNKKQIYLWFILLVSLFLFSELMAQGVKKILNVGAIRWEIVDQADEGEGSWGWGQDKTFARGYEDDFESTKAVMIASVNWTDTTGTDHPLKISGHGQWEVDDQQAVMPVPDAEGATIRRYLRRQPPAITIDGLRFDDPFPLNFTDHVDPDKIPGNADALIESFINTDMGVSIHHRVIGFSQQNHDQYMIREYTFINTGNVDPDPAIELENQDITGFYFLKQVRPHEWQKPWCGITGIYDDDLVVMYGYPSRDEGSDFDNLGVPDVEGGTGNLQNTSVAAEALLFASAGPGASFNTNDPNQPHATMYVDVDFTSFTFHSLNMTQFQQDQLYEVMQNGGENLEGINWPRLTGTNPGNHGVPLDERGFAYPNEMEGFGFSSSYAYSVGPYDIPFGDSVKVVIAQVYGNISPEKAFEVGQDWLNDEATFGDNDLSTDHLPPQYLVHPELYAADSRSELSNWAKDSWVLSGIDSVLQNAQAAKFAYDNNYTIPQPPPPPSVETKSFPGNVQITWGTESEEASDLAGYRIYRSKGRWWAGVEYGETEFLGGWELLATVGTGVNEYIDTSTQTGIAYFYAVTAFDDGTQNGTNFLGETNQVLESQIAANATQTKSESLSEAGTLEEIVIVPNPFNLAASQNQFLGEPNKITFFNVPSKCTIRIFTESGDLVKRIDHEGAGTAFWGNIAEEQSATQTGQVIASGIYIAYIETPNGKSTTRKFVVIR